jgi:hypothetical protein
MLIEEGTVLIERTLIEGAAVLRGATVLIDGVLIEGGTLLLKVG